MASCGAVSTRRPLSGGFGHGLPDRAPGARAPAARAAARRSPRGPQHRRVRSRAIPGSPLGGYDVTVAAAAKLAPDLPVICRPAMNEEYAASAVMGSQLAAAQPDCLYDGIVGIWYGKAPGVDRATDALRHAVYAGTSMHGGAVAIVGDDPAAKSSTLPSLVGGRARRHAHAGALPGRSRRGARPRPPRDRDVAADGPLVGAQDRRRRRRRAPRACTCTPSGSCRCCRASDGELYRHRPDGAPARAVQRRARARDLRGALRARAPVRGREPAQRRGGGSGRPRRSASSRRASPTARCARRSCASASRATTRSASCGIRILKMGMPLPFDAGTIRELRARAARGVRDRGEAAQHRGADQGRALRTRGSPGRGRQDRRARRPAAARARRARCRHPGADPAPADRGARRASQLAPEAIHSGRALAPLAVQRTPFFCSGCPHNRSTEVPEGSLVGAGIGCHTMIMLMDPERIGSIAGVACMGNEGTQWIGMADFVARKHFIQNLGDGTYFHSRPARDPGRGRREREHHLQAALQRHRRDDRRAASAGPASGARGGARAAHAGRRARADHDRRHGALPRRGAARAASRCGSARA